MFFFLTPVTLQMVRQMERDQSERARQQRNLATDLALAASRLSETLRRARAARTNQPTTNAP